jgi:uncharacterized protein (TIGR02145 family)
MKKVSLLLSSAVMFVTIFTSCGVDQDGNSFNGVAIGNQIWMAENLCVETFRNGDPILHAQTEAEWLQAGLNMTPAWCYQNNDHSNGSIYCKLYNWYAVNDPRGLAPDGWHIPSNAEWTQLINYLGGESVAGGKMKSTGTQYWLSPNTGATNQSGFSGLPGGNRGETGNSFSGIGEQGCWWSSTENSAGIASAIYLYKSHGMVIRYGDSKDDALSVRCIKD